MQRIKPSSYLALFVATLVTVIGSSIAEAGTPIRRDSNSLRYFRYNNKTLALVGASGDYLPHVAHTRTDWVSYTDYREYVNALAAQSLNKIRVWVGLNHSPGKANNYHTDPSNTTPPPEPYPHEQPFVYDAAVRKWDLSQWDETYFSRLAEVISYCESKGVIVELTLFDGLLGDWTKGPWNESQNKQGIGFTQERFFITFDSGTRHLDPKNISAFNKQKALVRELAQRLNGFGNLYWEIANEPDLGSSIGSETVDWHMAILQEIRSVEDASSNGRHLVAANVVSDSSLRRLQCWNSPTFCVERPHEQLFGFDVHNAHYAGVADTSRYSAISLARSSRTSGIYGFDETKISPIQATREAVRAEAWEFLVSSGGVYDHLGYSWQTTTAQQIRNDLSVLSEVDPIRRTAERLG